MTIPGVLRRAQASDRLRTGTWVALMGTLVASAWAIVPSHANRVASTTSTRATSHTAAAARTLQGAEASQGALGGPPVQTSPAAQPGPITQASPPGQAGAPTSQPVAATSSAPASQPQAPAPPPPPPPPAWADGLPPAGVAWSPYIDAAAAKAGLDPRLFASLVWAESNFDATATSGKGAVGLSQVMPTTAADLGVDPTNPLQNLDGGARYLKKNLDRFGRTDLALAAYNAGPTTVAQTGGVPAIPETVEYVGKVLSLFHTLAQ